MELVEKKDGKYYQFIYSGHNITLKIGKYEGILCEDAEHDDIFAPKLSLCKGTVTFDFPITYSESQIPQIKEWLDDIRQFIPEYREIVASMEKKPVE